MQVIVNIFPTNPIESMLKADMLQIIVFALFLGLGISMVGEPADTFKTPSTALPKYPIKL